MKGEIAMKTNRENMTKRIVLIFMILSLPAAAVAASTVSTGADPCYHIRVTHVFEDGSPAHDAYVATYSAGAQVDLTVTNPIIDGFLPMDAAEGGKTNGGDCDE